MNRINNFSREDEQKLTPGTRNGPAVVSLMLALLMLAALSYSRNAVWKNDIRIWKDAAGKSNNKARPHYNLGRLYRTEGRHHEALGEYLAAARFDPADAVTHYNAANTYLTLGRPDEAIPQYQSAITLKPDYADARYNLAVAVRMFKDRGMARGRKSGALSAVARNNAGNSFLSEGNAEAALAEYRAALTVNPGFAEAHYNLGLAYRSLGRDDEALLEYQAAVQFAPDDAMTHYNLGNLYYAKRRFDDARREYAAALLLKPDFGDARYNLHIAANALRSRTNTDIPD